MSILCVILNIAGGVLNIFVFDPLVNHVIGTFNLFVAGMLLGCIEMERAGR